MAVFSVAEDGETNVEITLKLPCEDSVCLLHQRGPDGCDISGQQSAHLRKVLKGVQLSLGMGWGWGIWRCQKRRSVV